MCVTATQQPIMDSRRLSLDEVIALLERPQVQGADDAMGVVTPGSDDDYWATLPFSMVTFG